MAWCPICKAEYREGFTVCSGCDCDLVNELENDKSEEKNEELIALYNEQVYLMNVRDEIEATVIESLLKDNSISVLKKFNESSGYISIVMGSSPTGIDIYVSQRNYIEAKAIIEAEIVSEEEENSFDSDFGENIEDESVSEEDESPRLVEQLRRFYHNKKVKAWIAILVLLPLGIGFLTSIYFAIKFFMERGGL